MVYIVQSIMDFCRSNFKLRFVMEHWTLCVELLFPPPIFFIINVNHKNGKLRVLLELLFTRSGLLAMDKNGEMLSGVGWKCAWWAEQTSSGIWGKFLLNNQISYFYRVGEEGGRTVKSLKCTTRIRDERSGWGLAEQSSRSTKKGWDEDENERGMIRWVNWGFSLLNGSIHWITGSPELQTWDTTQQRQRDYWKSLPTRTRERCEWKEAYFVLVRRLISLHRCHLYTISSSLFCVSNLALLASNNDGGIYGGGEIERKNG